MSDAKILISGATGLTGGAITAQLNAAGLKARALTRDPNRAAGLASETIEVVKGDLGDKDSLLAAMQGIRAAYFNVLPSAETLDQVDIFLSAAKQAGVSHVVKLSGFNASPESRSAVIRLHAEADRRVAASGLTYTIMRANSFYQNLLSQLPSIRGEGRFYMSLGDVRQSLIDVADLAAAVIVRLLDDKAESTTFDLTGPQALSFFEVAADLSAAFGREVTYVPITSEVFRDTLIARGVPDVAAASVAELFSVFAEGSYAGITEDFANLVGRPPRPHRAFAEEIAQNG